MAQPVNHGESRGHEKGLSVRAYQTETKCKLGFKDRTDVKPLQSWETRICLCLSTLPLDSAVVFYWFNLTRGTLLIPRALYLTHIWKELCSSKHHKRFTRRGLLSFMDHWLQLAVSQRTVTKDVFPCLGFRWFLWPRNVLGYCHWSTNLTTVPSWTHIYFGLTYPLPRNCTLVSWHSRFQDLKWHFVFVFQKHLEFTYHLI